MSDLTPPLVTAVLALGVVVAPQLTVQTGPVITAELTRLLHSAVKVQTTER